MKSRFAVVAGVLLLIGAAGGVWFQSNALSGVRDENQRLRAAREEVQRLTVENSEHDRLLAENREIETLRAEPRDLHKLRNEVHQLRKEVKGLPLIQDENRRLKAIIDSQTNATVQAAPAPPLIALDRVSYLGMETPEATLQSFFWAVRQEHLQAFRNCLTPERQRELETLTEEQIRERIERMRSEFKAFRIVARKDVSANAVELGLQVEMQDQQPQLKLALPFKRIAYEWKLDSPQ